MSGARRVAVAVGAVALVGLPFVVGGDDADWGLPAGFEVVEGSQLEGPGEPRGIGYYYKGKPVVDEGFEAILAVEGDPVPVMNAYLDQARALGLTEVAPPPVADGDSTSPGQVPCGYAGDRTRDVFTCRMTARTPDPSDTRSLALHFGRGAERHSQKFSHLLMTYSTVRPDWDFALDLQRQRNPVVPLDPAGSIPAPREQGRMFDGWDLIRPIKIETGSRLLAELPNFQCTAWTPEAVLQVTGNPRATLERYVDQITHTTGTEPPVISDPLGVPGGVLTTVGTGLSGGDSYWLTLFESDEDGAWLRIRSCYD